MALSILATDSAAKRDYDSAMEELAWVRHLVDRAIERLHTEMHDSPLLQLEPPELRRLLAEAAFREIRALQAEIRRESGA
jgi:hypothetical protein